MSKLDESIGFYRKISELQERLRRSEEERLQLEEKFAVLMRSCRDQEEERLNNLRERYEAFLEEERQRHERNDRILQALDRIESQAAMLTAKSERLRLLRRHYEAYMLKIYPCWKYVTKKFTDGQPSSQKLDPLNNKLNVETDRSNSYGRLQGSPSLLPVDSSRPAAHTQHQSYNTVSVLPTNHQFVSASRMKVDTSAAGTVDGLSSPSSQLCTVDVAGTQQEVCTNVVMTGEHILPAAQKAPPVPTQETLGSGENSAACQVESNKIRHLDDYLGRAAEMLKLSRTDDGQRDKNLSGYFNEINACSLKDIKHLGSSVDFELEQNTSGDLLNVSLSDDGVLQEESDKTFISPSQKGDNNRNLVQLQRVDVNAVYERDEVVSEQAEVHDTAHDEDGLVSKKIEDLHWESKLAHVEQNTQETVKCTVDDTENFETALDRKDGREFDNQQHLHPQKSTSLAGGESVIPDNSVYCGEKVFQLEEDNEVSHWKQQYSTMNAEVQNHDKQLKGETVIQGFERSVQDPLEREAEARRDNDEESAQKLVSFGTEVPVNESIYTGEGDQPDELYEGEEAGNRQLAEQKQWDENEQQYYQQYAGYQGDQYDQYEEDEIYRQHYIQEHVQGYDQQYMIQEGEQHCQQYGEQVKGHYSQEYTYQEGLHNKQQERQFEEQLDQYDQQEGQCSEQYVEQQAGQYDQYYEEYQLEPGVQHVSEEERTARDEEYNEDNSKEQNDQVSDELDQRQQCVLQRGQEDSICDGSSYKDGKYQEQMKVCDAVLDSVGEGSGENGSTSVDEEKTLSKVAEGKADDSTALPQKPDVSCDLTQASPSGDMKQYHQLFSKTEDPEQSDTDEMEMQLAALVESQQVSVEHGKQLQQSVPSRVKMINEAPVKGPAPAFENIDGNTARIKSDKNVEELASGADIKTSEVTGRDRNMHGTPEVQISSKCQIQTMALPKEGDPPKVPQPTVPRTGSKKLPGLTKMLESDTESLQLDATVSNEESDDFDFSSDK